MSKYLFKLFNRIVAWETRKNMESGVFMLPCLLLCRSAYRGRPLGILHLAWGTACCGLWRMWGVWLFALACIVVRFAFRRPIH